ncbi:MULTISPECIES: hypothetical protein [Flavobacteriaceae]|uniref:hypothetical protein n=1 Tax=Flavobacteriaceae TaxID=49546 RepID=UPI00149252F1|nr:MULTISPECIES: hypothetical protein [Allomuricauda]MDC6365993.1 hypothetical protein [Muricauda sp. AC10]
MKNFFLLLTFFGPFFALSQVKIGSNPQTIDPTSILELESSNKVLVLSRLSLQQMQSITPLHGAFVYNTDAMCPFYFDGNQWINLCNPINAMGFSFTDNGDGTITLFDGEENELSFDGAPETITTLVNNLDGTYTYTNESGTQTLINVTDSDDQTLSTDGTAGNIQISNGNTIALNVDDADADHQNEIQNLEFTNGVISLTLDPGNTTIDLSNYDSDTTDDFNGEWTSINNIPADILDGDANTVTNLVQDNSTGVITYTNENATDQTANVIATDINNSISVGSNGGVFYESPIKAFGKIAQDGTAIRVTAGIMITKLPGSGHYQITLPLGLVNDSDYIIQLAQPSREGAGSDDPGISYLNQTSTGFEVIVGDNDNGGTDRSRFDSEFMFTILDL